MALPVTHSPGLLFPKVPMLRPPFSFFKLPGPLSSVLLSGDGGDSSASSMKLSGGNFSRGVALQSFLCNVRSLGITPNATAPDTWHSLSPCSPSFWEYHPDFPLAGVGGTICFFLYGEVDSSHASLEDSHPSASLYISCSHHSLWGVQVERGSEIPL